MVIRACLVALDWNYNVDRRQKQSSSGQLQYRKKVRIANQPGQDRFNFSTFPLQVDRTGSRSSVVPVKVAKDSSWQDAIYSLCLESLESGQMPNPEVLISILTDWRVIFH